MPTESHFLADVHLPLSPDARTLRFARYLRSCDSGKVSQIFLLGDIFHYWVHRSRKIRDAYGEVVAEIRRAVDRGITVHFFPGNRDFLIAHSCFQRGKEEGVQFHSGPLVADLGRWHVYVGHGDELCLDDRLYLLWRRFARSRVTLLLFDCLPESWRDRLVEGMSRTSRRLSSEEPIQVPSEAYKRIFQAGANVIIHGHLHVSAHTTFEDPGGEVWVLPDWDEGAHVLVYDRAADEFELKNIDA